MSRITHRILVALVASLVALPALAGESVYLFRTQEDPSVTPTCAADETVRLGALLYTPRTRANDGMVVVDASDPVGTAIGCGKLLTYTPFDPNVQSPFSMVFALNSGVSFTAKGTCTITSLTFPIPGVPAPLLLVGCALDLDANPDAAIVNGLATSASVFTPRPLPGYGTGSFWTVQVYTAD